MSQPVRGLKHKPTCTCNFIVMLTAGSGLSQASLSSLVTWTFDQGVAHMVHHVAMELSHDGSMRQNNNVFVLSTVASKRFITMQVVLSKTVELHGLIRVSTTPCKQIIEFGPIDETSFV